MELLELLKPLKSVCGEFILDLDNNREKIFSNASITARYSSSL